MAKQRRRRTGARSTKAGARRVRAGERLDRALVLAVAFVVFSTPLFMLTTISEYGYGKSIYALVAISVLTLLWSASAWVHGTFSFRWPWIGYPFLGFVAAGLFSLLAAVNGRVVVQSLVLVVYFFQLLLIISHAIRSRRDVYLLLFALLASGVLAGLYGLLQYIGVMRGSSGGTGLNQIISVMGNRNYLGGFLAYLLFPSVILVLSLRTWWLRLLASGMMAFCFGIVLLVDQMGTLIALIATLIAFVLGIILFRCYAPIRRNRTWLIALIAMLGVTFAVHAPSSPLNAVVGLSAEEPGWIARFWQSHSGRTREVDSWVGWEMFKDSPLVGVGLGHYKIRFLEYKSVFLSTERGDSYSFSMPPAAQAHNDYIQALAELGTLGGLAVAGFLALLAWLVWRRIRRSRDAEERLEMLLLACGVLPFLIHAAGSFPAHLPASSLVLTSLIGLLSCAAYGEEGISVWRLSRTTTRTAAMILTAAALVASGLALSDLYANILMTRGLREIQQGRLALGESLLRRSLRYDFAPRQTFFLLASVQLQQNRRDEAWENLERCLTRYVDEAVYLTYANLAAHRGELEKAHWAVALLLNGNPTREIDQQARYVEALIAFQARDHQRATELLEKLTEDHPSYATGWIALGDLYAMQGRSVAARRVLEQGLTHVDRQLARAQAKLTPGMTVSLEDYSSIQLEIQRLEQQRRIARELLAELP